MTGPKLPTVVVAEHRVRCELESCACGGDAHDGVCQLCGPLALCDVHGGDAR